MIKSIVQCALVAIRVAFKDLSPLTHGILFIIVITIFMIIQIKRPSLNYHRACIISVFSLALLVFYGLIALLSQYFLQDYFNTWTFTLLVGWSILMVSGLWIMLRRYPNLLYRAPAKDIRQLYRFAFTCLDISHFGNLNPKLNYYVVDSTIEGNYFPKTYIRDPSMALS